MKSFAKRGYVHNVKMSFRLFYQRHHEAHLCILAAPPSISTSCTHSHAHIKDNSCLHMQGRVTIGCLASQPFQAHNESLHRRTLSSALQMGVHHESLRHHLLPSHYWPASYFHDACFHCAPVKVHPPPKNMQEHCCF